MTVEQAIRIVGAFQTPGGRSRRPSQGQLAEAVRVLERSSDGRARMAARNGRQLLDAETSAGRAALQRGTGIGGQAGGGVSVGRATAGSSPSQRSGPGGGAIPGGSTGNAGIDSILQGLSGGAGAEPPAAIGGYWAGGINESGTGYDPAPLSGQRVGGDAASRFASKQQPYFEGSEAELLSRMSAEQRARLQDLLVATGLASSVIPGEMDDGTLQGFSRLLGMSNRNGERWSQTFSRLQAGLDSGEIEDQGPEGAAAQIDPGYVGQSYLPPDPAELRNAIRDTASQIVPDVDLSDEEVDFLRTQFEQFGRQQFDAAQVQDRAEFDATAVAAETGEDQTVAATGGTVNAAERFREFFEQRYADNIDLREDQEEEIERRQVTGGNLSSLMSFATGRTV